MTEEFTIQCESCGTLYNDLQEVCPYCGEPQPLPPDASLPDAYYIEPDPDDYYQAPDDDYLPGEADLPPVDDYLAEDDPFADDDIFAIAPQTEPAGYDEPGITYPVYEEPYLPPDELDYLDDLDETYADPALLDPYDPDAELADFPHDLDLEEDEEVTPASQRFTWRRIALGCLGLLLCGGLLYGGIGFFAVRAGLQERAANIQAESEAHYQKGQELLANNSIELAIAEFELAISINPNFTAARQALREAQRIAQAQPTPTSQTRTAAAAETFAKAQTQLEAQNWAEAIQTLLQVRDLDAAYEVEQVSGMLHESYLEFGRQLVAQERLDEALAAFAQALAERPDDPESIAEQTKAALYLDGIQGEAESWQAAVSAYSQLHQVDPAYLDVEQRLVRAYESFGDELAEAKAWCEAHLQYLEANVLRASAALEGKASSSSARCESATPGVAGSAPPRATIPPAESSGASSAPIAATVTPTGTLAAPPAAGAGQGSILFSSYNSAQVRWEILSVPVGGGTPELVTIGGTMPAVSPNGKILLYHSEMTDSEGLHALNLVTGEDVRVTTVRDHILPRWGGENNPFLFVAQEGGTGRWLVYQSFADGKSDPIILQDGRTPDWSPDGATIAYQGTNAEGNEPGIYLAPFGGGTATRLTNHESDRSPDFSPDGRQIAYMSTRNGNWDIFTVSTAGSSPRQITTAPGNDGLPVWSPDGTQLAYISDAGGSWAIYVVSAAGGAPTKVTDWDGSNHPDWLLTQIWWRR